MSVQTHENCAGFPAHENAGCDIPKVAGGKNCSSQPTGYKPGIVYAGSAVHSELADPGIEITHSFVLQGSQTVGFVGEVTDADDCGIRCDSLVHRYFFTVQEATLTFHGGVQFVLPGQINDSHSGFAAIKQTALNAIGGNAVGKVTGAVNGVNDPGSAGNFLRTAQLLGVDLVTGENCQNGIGEETLNIHIYFRYQVKGRLAANILGTGCGIQTAGFFNLAGDKIQLFCIHGIAPFISLL